MAAVAWVGGSLFYVIVLNPALDAVGRTQERLSLLAAVGQEFREVVRLAIVILVATGAVLAFTRLNQPRLSVVYVIVLAVKATLSVWMFWLAGRIGRKSISTPPTRKWKQKLLWLTRPQYLILVLGLVIYFLSFILRIVYEQSFGLPL